MKHTKKWFINRISKRIYRNPVKCCATCEEVNKNGIVVRDEQHADYLEMVQYELGLDYRDRQ